MAQEVLCEGWMEHKSQGPPGIWKPLWFVLKENIIYIFEDRTAQDTTHIGCLTIDENVKFKIEKDGRNEYKFALTTKGPRTNKFKTKKKSEREKWRAYLVGISKGVVPQDIDLLDSEIDRIQADIDKMKNSGDISRHSRFSDESGIGAETVSNASGSGGSITLQSGGPTIRHNFYRDDHIRGSRGVPSWFFANCPRPLAEAILVAGREFGNTLMRESTTFSESGSYVISKRVDRLGRDPTFEHYEVIRTAQGYKIKVENKHEAMKCLSEVMTYFMKTSGISETNPMSTNNMAELGLDIPDYATRIPLTKPAAPWVWPPDGNQPPPDYDDARTAGGRRDGQFGSQTVNPVRLNREQERNPSAYGPHKTVGASRRQPTIPTMDDIAFRHQEEDGLAHLEQTISSFEDPFYQNASVPVDQPDRQQISRPPSLPPPSPHKLGAGQRYVNQEPEHFSYVNEEKDQMESAVFSLPPAPPPPPPVIPQPPPPPPVQTMPPKSQAASQSTGAAKSIKTLPKSHSESSIGQNQPPVAPKPAKSAEDYRKEKVKQLESFGQRASALRSTGLRSSNDSGPRPKSFSPSESKPLRHSQSLDSADTTPEWQKNLKKRSQLVKPPTALEPSAKQTENEGPVKAGVDESRPGGVNTIRSKFNLKIAENQHKGINSSAESPLGTAKTPTQHAIVKPEFLQQLERVVGSPKQASAPRPLHHGAASSPQLTEDHEYQAIPADEVFYVNDKYNT